MNEVWLVILPLIAGYLLDLAFGDPRTIPHPVVGFGNMISWAERHFNCGRFRKWKGAVVALSFPLFVGMIGWGITVGTLAVGDWCFCIVASVFVFYGLANHSLIQEGREVIDTLKKQGVEAGRRRLSWIVGRDTSELSPKEIYTAVLETMAENLSDGVVAPLFYYALGGFPAMMAYKMVNTLDSMIGYKDERYRQFGCMAARLDDVLNYIPAMAGILDCRFGGAHVYHGLLVEKPYIGDNDREISYADFRIAVRVNHRVTLLTVVSIVAVYLCVFIK